MKTTMSVIQDGAGRLPWVCRSCNGEMWSSAHGAGYGCHHCGSNDVETYVDGVGWLRPNDGRLLARIGK